MFSVYIYIGAAAANDQQVPSHPDAAVAEPDAELEPGKGYPQL